LPVHLIIGSKFIRENGWQIDGYRDCIRVKDEYLAPVYPEVRTDYPAGCEEINVMAVTSPNVQPILSTSSSTDQSKTEPHPNEVTQQLEVKVPSQLVPPPLPLDVIVTGSSDGRFSRGTISIPPESEMWVRVRLRAYGPVPNMLDIMFLPNSCCGLVPFSYFAPIISWQGPTMESNVLVRNGSSISWPLILHSILPGARLINVAAASGPPEAVIHPLDRLHMMPGSHSSISTIADVTPYRHLRESGALASTHGTNEVKVNDTPLCPTSLTVVPEVVEEKSPTPKCESEAQYWHISRGNGHENPTDDDIATLDALFDPVKVAVDSIPFPDLSPKQADEVKQILRDFKEVHCPTSEQLGDYKGPEYRVQTGTHSPVYTRQYPLPHAARQALSKLVHQMLDKGVISRKPPDTPGGWNTPHFLVKKQGGGDRPVADFRPLNCFIERFIWPVPSTIETLQRVTGARFFSKMDLRSGYHQVRVRLEDRHKLCFTTDEGTFYYNRVPMGLIDAPNFFCYVMSTVLSDLIGKGVVIYIDDILVYSETFEEHLRLLRLVMERLQAFGLTLSSAKCTFARKPIAFL